MRYSLKFLFAKQHNFNRRILSAERYQKKIYIFKLIPIEIILSHNLKKVFIIENQSNLRILNALNVLVSTTLYKTTFWVLYFQINHFQCNDFVTYFSSVFYFVLLKLYFLAVIDCKRYRVRLHNDPHFLLLVYFLFPMICDMFTCIFQLVDKVGVFYQ